jgi:hypothetical protein
MSRQEDVGRVAGLSLREVVSRATLANVAAFIIAVTGFAYGVYTRNTELVRDILLIALGYLFGKTAK